MAHHVDLELPDDVFSVLRTSPGEFVKELRTAAAVKWYEVEMISQSKAAEIAGLTRHEFLDALSRLGASPFQEVRDDLERGALDRETESG